MVWERDHKRREFLKLAAFSLAGLTTTGARGLGQAQREPIQRPETPERALSLLAEGNQRFVAQNLISFKEDLDILKTHSEEHQEPFAAVLSCADSRVPVELVFDQSIGHLFVVRVAGNIVAPSQIGSVEFVAERFKTRLVVVLGHSSCGVIQATLEQLATRPLDEWAQIFAGEPDFFWSPVNALEDVVADEQFHAAGGLVDVPVDVPDGESSVAMVATPADFHGTPWAPRSAAPELGQHTQEVLAELEARRRS